jgi:hypothetical protein
MVHFIKQKVRGTLKSHDAKTICRMSKKQAQNKCKKAHQSQTKTYWQRFNQSHKEHETMILYIKIFLIMGIAIMAAVFHYKDFIVEHPDLFGMEVLTYSCCAFVAYVFTCFLRNQSFTTMNFVVGAFKIVLLTIVVVVMAELAGLNTKFIQEDTSKVPMNEYKKNGLKFKKQLWGNIIIGANLAFITGLVILHYKENDRGSFTLLVVGVLIAILSQWIPIVKTLHQKLNDDHWLVKGGDVSNSEIGMFIFFSVLFVVFAIVVLVASLFRYDTFKIYSYFPNNPNMCGTKRAVSTIFLFMFESLMVAFMVAVPVLYVSRNRNNPEMGHEYKMSKDKEAFIDLGLISFKIFVFLVALQMTGLFDGYNQGFCRVRGCNVRVSRNAKKCQAVAK